MGPAALGQAGSLSFALHLHAFPFWAEVVEDHQVSISYLATIFGGPQHFQTTSVLRRATSHLPLSCLSTYWKEMP